MRRGLWLLALPLALLLLAPPGSPRVVGLVVAVVFLVALCAASRADLRERNAPDWIWLLVWGVGAVLTPLGGFVVWMFVRQRWPLPPRVEG